MGPGGSGTTVATSTIQANDLSNGGPGRYSLSPQKKVKSESIPYEFLMANLRDTHGYLVIDKKKRGLTKKKRFLPKEARALQSKINLKFPEMQIYNSRKTSEV